MKILKKAFALLLCLVMVASMLPMSVFAEGQTYVLTVSAEPAEGGTVYIDTPGVTEAPCDGSGYRLIAETNDGYKLVGWYKNDSFQTNHYINMAYPSAQTTQDYNYVAKFAKNINNIEITMPGKAGDTLNRTTVSVPDGAGYQIQSFDKLYVYESADSENYTYIGGDTQCVLAAGNVVRGNILMANPLSGYAYDSISKITATVNGKSATVGDMYSKPYITFEYTVSALAPTPEVTTIASVDTRLLQYPATDKSISKGFSINSCDPVSSAGYTGYASIYVCDTNSNTFDDWTSASGKYAASKYYMVATEVRANEGYAFDDSLTKTIGGLAHDDRFDSQFTNTDTIQTIVHIYGPLEEPEAVSSLAFTVPEPKVGEKVDWSTWSVSGDPAGSVEDGESGFFVSDTDPDDWDDLTYVPNNTEFQAGKYYVFVGDGVPTDGYKLTSSITKTVNGAAHDTTFDDEHPDYYGYAIRVWGPLEAAPAPTLYNVWVAGTQVTSDNASDVLGDGAASYDAATNTLTASKNITATGDSVSAIKATTEDDFTVDIDGSVAISSEDGNGIEVQNKAIVTGGSLTITADSYGIYADEITVGGGTYIVSGWRGLLGKSGVAISNATVTITAKNNAIYSYNDKCYISISNSTVTATSTDNRSIFIEEDGEETITISDSTVTVTGDNCAVYAPKVEVTGNSVVEMKATITDTPDDDYCALSGCGDNFIVAETLEVLASTEVDGSNPVPYVKADRVKYDWVKIEKAAPAPTVTLDQDSLALEVGETAQLTATVANGPEAPTLTWSSDAEAVATVDASGKVTAKGPGTATITVTLVTAARTTISDTCTVTVTEKEIPTTSVTVNKVWKDVPSTNTSGLPQSVTVFLLANGSEVTDSSVQLTAAKQWAHTWTDLPTITEDGSAIEYTVGEMEVEGFTATITKDATATNSFTITNTWVPVIIPTTTITVVKEWDAPEGTVLPKSVSVYLMADGKKVTGSDVTLSDANDWTHTWTREVDPTANKQVVYSVGEKEVSGYTTTIGNPLETDTGIEIAITNTKVVPVEYTVTYKANGGKGTMTADTVEDGEKYTLRANKFTAPSGKVFRCWKIDGRTYTPGQKITIDGDVTVTAVWKTKTDVPETGDSGEILLWGALLAVSVAGLAGVVLYRRKKSE